MLLKAYPKPGCPVREPGHSIPTPGQPVRRLGLQFDYEKKEHVPSGVPCQCDETAEGARELLKAIRQDAALVADAETAAAAGVPFVELEVGEDKWAKPKAAAPRVSKKAEG
jgi:hypothetical protein